MDEERGRMGFNRSLARGEVTTSALYLEDLTKRSSVAGRVNF